MDVKTLCLGVLSAQGEATGYEIRKVLKEEGAFSHFVDAGYQPVEKGVIDRVSRHGEAYRGEGGFAILRDDEDDLNDQDGSSGRNKHEQGANEAAPTPPPHVVMAVT